MGGQEKGKEGKGLDCQGREEGLEPKDRTGRGNSPHFACLVQGSKSVVCQEEQVVAKGHSKGNEFLLGNCQGY